MEDQGIASFTSACMTRDQRAIRVVVVSVVVVVDHGYLLLGFHWQKHMGDLTFNPEMFSEFRVRLGRLSEYFSTSAASPARD